MCGENSWQAGLVCIRKKANKQHSYKVFILFLHPGSYFQISAFASPQYCLTLRPNKLLSPNCLWSWCLSKYCIYLSGRNECRLMVKAFIYES